MHFFSLLFLLYTALFTFSMSFSAVYVAFCAVADYYFISYWHNYGDGMACIWGVCALHLQVTVRIMLLCCGVGTQPAFTRLPWRGTPCPSLHAGTLLFYDIILAGTRSLRSSHPIYKSSPPLTLRHNEI